MKVLKNSLQKATASDPRFKLQKNYIGLNKFSVSTLDGIYIYAFKDVLYCTSKSNYTEIHFINGSRILVSRTLKLIQDLFPSNLFCRTHQSFLIHLHKVKIIKSDTIVLHGDIEIPVAKSKHRQCQKQVLNTIISI